jgi:hypothetical protein
MELLHRLAQERRQIRRLRCLRRRARAAQAAVRRAEALVVAWLRSLSLLWGLRERRMARGFGLSVALHEGVNAIAVARFSCL